MNKKLSGKTAYIERGWMIVDKKTGKATRLTIVYKYKWQAMNDAEFYEYKNYDIVKVVATYTIK